MRESYLIRIASDPPARIWSGEGDLEIPADGVEDAPATYLGRAALVNIPAFQQLINGTAERIEITVGGVSDETLRLALEDAPSVKGAAVHIGSVRFDSEWQIDGAVEWEAIFRADGVSVNSQDGDNGRSRSITVSIGSEETSRSQAAVGYFTDADQRRRSPTDAIFSHVAGIRLGTSRRFGAT